ncbi:beta-galactosidase [Arthrobacter sp. AQ5-05]|uniref:glycoside hydrolase family 35 protein n=1 Tax=Arthrobacter sp. AQ5-05 TaxID=2184581 RepID=UPI000DCE524C|nr:beta-galactosidase family protein [Arthrobacter sp. AQ5-05]RAX49844.1 beta-galactosidase [Arthrobacter sp. AQ5-05]
MTQRRGHDWFSLVRRNASAFTSWLGTSFEPEPRNKNVIISGALHYFRTHPEQWRSRLHWLRLMGLDTVETYVPWNLHEPRQGQFNFSGGADLERFVKLAAEEGLKVILRPGPYICAEWDNGGLPSWLTAQPGIRVRTRDTRYVAAVEAFFDELLPRMVPLLETHGGPISMVQVENEYGSFGSDARYLELVHKALVQRGIDVPLFTSDGPEDHMLTGGMVPGITATANFGSGAGGAFANFRRHRPNDPLFCMEFWNGWFDHWGEEHHVRRPQDAAEALDEMLTMGSSVNFYMAHGGTNFGTGAGANYVPPHAVSGGTYQPTITSYDYDAPLDERGAPTPKFHAYREVIAKHRRVPELEEFNEPLLPHTQLVPEAAPVGLRAYMDLLASHGNPTIESGHPLSFEELGISHGVVRYATTIPGPRRAYPLSIDGLNDRAHLAVGGHVVHVFERNDQQSHDLPVPPEGLAIELYVESMGRVNYGRLVGERKGILGAVLHERQELHGWSMTALELPQAPADELLFQAPAASPGEAAFHAFGFVAAGPADGFIDLSGWGKGYVWVNGFCLGRFWDAGPQARLYLPAPVVRSGDNRVLILELDGRSADAPAIFPAPDLGAGSAPLAPQ